MAEHQRLLDDERADPAVLVVVHVGPADTDGAHLDENVALSDLRQRTRLEADVVRPVQRGHEHLLRLRRTARELGAPRLEVAEKLEEAALAALRERSPDRVLATNVEFWSAVVLDYAEVPPDLFTPMFTCARVAGWSAHILEQKREGRLVRPTAAYIGPAPRKPDELE